VGEPAQGLAAGAWGAAPLARRGARAWAALAAARRVPAAARRVPAVARQAQAAARLVLAAVRRAQAAARRVPAAARLAPAAIRRARVLAAGRQAPAVRQVLAALLGQAVWRGQVARRVSVAVVSGAVGVAVARQARALAAGVQGDPSRFKFRRRDC
jgi:hypothetical protein